MADQPIQHAESVAHFDWKTNKGVDSRGVRYWKVRKPFPQCPEPLGSFRCEREDGHRGVHMSGQYRWRTRHSDGRITERTDDE